MPQQERARQHRQLGRVRIEGVLVELRTISPHGRQHRAKSKFSRKIREPMVVVAALSAGVLDPANIREAVCCLVQERVEHLVRALNQLLGCNEDLG